MDSTNLFSHPQKTTASPRNTSQHNDVAALVFSDAPRRDKPEDKGAAAR
ncbi:hypothetical protein [[Mycobacterium] wendilense]|uniref:Uncharacterized protein n=1 Tax=[Mycobacterium] wendilense TaxID=3064284 RepID=A0ABM9MB84_9MYCO|nr:hypothetical protein [Mycolicibacterium sp. MU0050]CAJ1580903.1 hypothetical protein MU0050_001263 [Mycolicibacterium sp. MU0050]